MATQSLGIKRSDAKRDARRLARHPPPGFVGGFGFHLQHWSFEPPHSLIPSLHILPALPVAPRLGSGTVRGMSTLTIELSDDIAARLAAASEREHLPPAQIVQAALEKALPAPGNPPPPGESLAEKMKDLIGCFDSGVTDLATNPKHLEGFGEWRK